MHAHCALHETNRMQQAEGAGGGMFNDGGIVRFEDAATFSENAGLVSAERAKESALYVLRTTRTETLAKTVHAFWRRRPARDHRSVSVVKGKSLGRACLCEVRKPAASWKTYLERNETAVSARQQCAQKKSKNIKHATRADTPAPPASTTKHHRQLVGGDEDRACHPGERYASSVCVLFA